MKYDQETIDQIVADYKAGVPVADIALSIEAPTQSVIAKLSSLGVYVKKQYKNKRGEVPIRKEAYLIRIAALMQVNLEMVESLEKCNKNVLILLEKALSVE